jgi:hypothetical protein
MEKGKTAEATPKDFEKNIIQNLLGQTAKVMKEEEMEQQKRHNRIESLQSQEDFYYFTLDQ